MLAAASEGWAASQDGEVVVNIAAALAGAQLPATVAPKCGVDAVAADASNPATATADACTNIPGIATAEHGAGGPTGKQTNKDLDLEMNMVYRAVPVGEAASLGVNEITRLVSEELAAQSAGMEPEPAGDATNSPSTDAVHAPSPAQMQEPTEAAVTATPHVHTTAQGSHSAARRNLLPNLTAPTLAGTDSAVAAAAAAFGVPLNARSSRMPMSRPAAPPSAANTAAVTNLLLEVDQPTEKLSLFSREGQIGMLQKVFPSLFHSAEFDYFSTDGCMNPEKTLAFLLHWTLPDGHRPCAEHPVFSYCMWNMNTRLNLNGLKLVVADRAFAGKSVAEVLESIESGTDKDVFKRVRGFCNQMPGTKSFWAKVRSMAYGFTGWKHWESGQTATIFFTITSADNWWPSFFESCLPADTKLQVLGGHPDNMNEDNYNDTLSRQNVVSRHVAIAVEHYRQVLSVFKHAFLEWGLGATDWFHRDEAQSRQALHTHGWAYCEGAPKPAVLQRACDFFQRFDSTNMPARKRLPGTEAQRVALEQVIEYAANVLELTGLYAEPDSCKRCHPGAGKATVDNTELKRKFSTVDSAEMLAARWNSLRRRYQHRHSRAYCLRDRNCAEAKECPEPKSKRPRKFLKCRFDFFFKTCACTACLGENYCAEHALEFEAEETHRRAEAEAAGKEFVVLQCVCAKCTCKCGQSCADVEHMPHIHVIRNSKDEHCSRHFRILAAMNHGAMNITIKAAMLAFGCMVDFQMLVDPAKAQDYVLKYTCKPESDGSSTQTELLRLVKKCADNGVSEKSTALRVLNGLVTERSCGNWEVMACAMRMGMYQFSRDLAALNTTGGVVVAVERPEDSDSDDSGDETAGLDAVGQPKELKKLKDAYSTYAFRKQLHAKSWYWCRTYANPALDVLHPEGAYVKIQPNPKCKLPGIDASAEDKEVLKFEYWCENMEKCCCCASQRHHYLVLILILLLMSL